MVTVTLEALDHYTSHMHEMSRAGIFGEGEMPWAVSLESLRIISEMTEFPSQFLHYLLRRLDVNKLGKFRFFDELDIFGCYLQHGLYLDGDQQVEEADSILFTSFATGFDDYYFYEIGLRETPAHKPIQAMPDLFRKLLLELEGHSDASGFSEVVLQLLNWDGEARNQLASNLERVRVMTLEDGKNHNFTIVSKQAQTGITCVSATEAHQQWGLAELMMLVRRKTTEFRYSQWLGLLTCVGGSSLVHGVFIDHYDESQG